MSDPTRFAFLNICARQPLACYGVIDISRWRIPPDPPWQGGFNIEVIPFEAALPPHLIRWRVEGMNEAVAREVIGLATVAAAMNALAPNAREAFTKTLETQIKHLKLPNDLQLGLHEQVLPDMR